MDPQPRSVRAVLQSVVLSKGRMEALTDGIFAIAMTLLVLELKVPDLPKSVPASELPNSLSHEMPAYFSFLVSFMYC
ncbi:MAG TPA: TMEM175 family protein, partial [Candidatus Limnocylindrales bacterium]|nr:TMEM175 family protein [Candidatus Limnocylindrales bacterium]